MNTMLSVAVLFIIVIISLVLVVSIGRPIIDATVKTGDIKGGENDLHFIDNYIRTVAAEGTGSMRIYKFSSPKDFESIPDEDTIQFYTVSPVQLIEHLTRSFSGSFTYISGADVNCQEKDGDGDGTVDLVAENTRIKAVFTKVASGTVYTDSILKQLTDKTNNNTVSVGNSSILIDENPATSAGTGFVRIGKSGINLPVCHIHAFVNSTLHYDVHYKLYAGADFIQVEVTNIGEG